MLKIMDTISKINFYSSASEMSLIFNLEYLSQFSSALVNIKGDSGKSFFFGYWATKHHPECYFLIE